MGLAASQARFLAITSRKMNCEFQSMQIAQQKLDVTRDLQTAAQDYQNSLSATKLVWDTGDNDTYDLSYDLLMTPSALNEYDPYLITESTGKIVLSDTMFNAAVAAGIIDADTGNPIAKANLLSEGTSSATNDGSRNAFLYQLGVANQVDGSTVDAIKNLTTSYTKSGAGGQIYDKTTANALTTTAFINYLSSATYGDYYTSSNMPSGVSSSDYIYSMNFIDALSATGYEAVATTNLDTKKSQYTITQNGNAVSLDNLKKLTLGDVLTGKYELSAVNCDIQSIANAVLSKMAELLGNGSQDIKGLNVDNESDEALSEAYSFTINQYSKGYATSKDSSKLYDLYTLAREQNNVITGKDNKSSFSITNMLKSYLTNFSILLDGFEAGFGIETDSAKKSDYITDDLNYYFILEKNGSMLDQTELNADFYNMLYNQLCLNGASADTNKQQMVTDKEYLSNALKNGQLFISSLNTDGYFYGGAYTLSGYVTEVTDEDAIARAEAEYTVTKSKLNYKEETLELEMKNLDTEISALTTEFDTVKSLISKNIEKVFTLFSS